MCGIAGLVSALPADRALDVAARMRQTIFHRGPDGGGQVVRDNVALAMSRLAIVDIEHGHQPMSSADGTITVVYNGEIYNAPALRRKLVSEGVTFRTRSDTEVLLKLYEKNPDEVEEHLVGMWAFAIHDGRRQRVVLSRDRFGIKPLFVVRAGAALAFASELTCFRHVRDVPGLGGRFEFDTAAAHAMLSWGYVPHERTIYRGVDRLEPGTRLEWDLDTSAAITRRYWTLQPSRDAARVQTLEEACAFVEPILARAVREHLESDVPVATFLSGGVDSSLVTAFARDATDRPIEAYSIGFDEPRFDESPFARQAAARIGVPITVERLTEEKAKTALFEALVAYDEPFGDSSSLATFLLARTVARRHKVALGGDGGDEAFAGYQKHRIVRFRETFDRMPGARDALVSAIRTLPARTDRTRGWTNLVRVLHKVARGLGGADDGAAYVALTQVASLARTASLVSDHGALSNEAELFEATGRERYAHAYGSQLQRTLASDLRGPLPNDMLTKVDRASMACHLEARVPFLDHRVVEAGVGLPSAFTLGNKGKRVLRALHAKRFGAELANRPKQGFGVPVERWLGQSLASTCDHLFERRRLARYGLLSPDELGDRGWRRWLRDHPQVLWHAFALAAWCEVHQGGGPDALRAMLPSSERENRTTPA